MAKECECNFVDTCSCEASLEFMRCITNACGSRKCACHDGDSQNSHHFSTCTKISAACPRAGLQCSTNGTHTCGAPISVSDTPVFSIVKKLSGSAKQVAHPATAKTWKEWLYDRQWLVRTMVALIQLIPFLIAALIYDKFRYQKNLFSQKPLQSSGGLSPHFSYSLFTCHQDWKICLLACCCFPLRWADTMEKAPRGRLLRYWVAVLIIILLNALSPLLAGVTTIIALVVCTVMRQKLREQLWISFGGVSILEDCCVYLWCSCCAVVQEARQVEAGRNAPLEG